MITSPLHQKLKSLNKNHLRNLRAALLTIEAQQKVLDSYGLDNDLINSFGGAQFVREDIDYLIEETSSSFP